MRYILSISRFLKYILINNPGKIIPPIISFILLTIAYNVEDSVKYNVKYALVSSSMVGAEYISIYSETNTHMKVVSYNIDRSLDTPKESFIKEQKKEWYYIVLSFGYIFGAISIVLFAMSVFGADDAEWEFDKAFRSALKPLVKCYFEEGKYQYIINGRLLAISNSPIVDPIYHYRINDMSDILSLPKYDPKSVIREKKLDKIIKK